MEVVRKTFIIKLSGRRHWPKTSKNANMLSEEPSQCVEKRSSNISKNTQVKRINTNSIKLCHAILETHKLLDKNLFNSIEM